MLHLLSFAMTLGLSFQPQLSEPLDEPMIVRIPLHWVGSFASKSSSTYVCPGHRVSIALRHSYIRTRHSVEIHSVVVNDVPESPQRLAEINRVLEEFAWSPEISPECAHSHVRLRMRRLDQGQVAEERVIQLR